MIENSGTPAETLASFENDSSFVDLDAPTGASETNAESDDAGEGESPDEGDEGTEADAGETAGETEGSDEADGADEGEDEGEAEKPEPEVEKKKPSGSERLKRRVASLEAQLAEATAVAKALPVGDAAALKAAVEKAIGPAPKESDYENFLDFERERTAYALDERQATREIKARSENAAAAVDRAEIARRDELVADHGERLTALEKVLPGSREKLKALASANVEDHVVALMLDSDKSALLALHIAENPSVLTDLNGMSEARAAREIGRLEARLSLPKPKTATNAPKPLGSVKGSVVAATADSQLDAWLSKQYGSK